MSDNGFTGARAEFLIDCLDFGQFGTFYAFPSLLTWHAMCDEIDTRRANEVALKGAIEALRHRRTPDWPCGPCRGKGYLLDQTYGAVTIPADCRAVQRCDNCDVYPGDDDAAYVANLDLQGHGIRLVMPDPEPADGSHLGEWCVVVKMGDEA